MSKHCYFPSSRDNERRRNAIVKAKERANATNEWFATNKLTKDNLDEFKTFVKTKTK